jgi:transposase
MKRHVRKHRVFRKAAPALFSEPWEDLIPLGHEVRLMRDIFDALDLEFLKEVYGVQGGVAYDPRRLLAVVLYGIGDGVRSTRQLQEHCRFDNRYRFLMDGLTPDDRTFGRFLERLNDEPEKIMKEVLQFAQDRITLRVVSVDGTKLKGSVSQYKKALDGIEISDPDASRMKDRTGYFNGFNCCSAVDADSGLIVGVSVSQDAADWHQLEPVLDSVEALSGRNPEAVVADSGFENFANADLCASRKIESHLAPNPKIWPGWEVAETGQVICPQGHALVAKDLYFNRHQRYQRYRIPQCSSCPLRATCLTGKMTYRTLSAPEGVDPSARILNFHRARSDEGLYLLARRGQWSETPHAQLKHNDGIRQFQRRGLGKVRVEFLLWAISYNLRKLLGPFLELLGAFWPVFGRIGDEKQGRPYLLAA